MAHPDIARDTETARSCARATRAWVSRRARFERRSRAPSTASNPPPDFVPAAIAAREKLVPAGTLLCALHGRDGAAADVPDVATRRAALERLAWAEAFTRVWQRIALRTKGRAGGPRALPVDRAVLARLRAELGFSLTAEQEKAIDAIARDLAHTAPMRRLLLGDVGTGKTAVALAAAAQCVSAGAQVAILAPTSVLAEQYMDAVGPLARATGASVALLAAGVPAAQGDAGRKGSRGGLSRSPWGHTLC